MEEEEEEEEEEGFGEVVCRSLLELPFPCLLLLLRDPRNPFRASATENGGRQGGGGGGGF